MLSINITAPTHFQPNMQKLSKYTEHQQKRITSFKEHYVLKLITSKLIIFEYKQAIVLLIKHI